MKLCCDNTRNLFKQNRYLCISLSRPAWDAWIEIEDTLNGKTQTTSRPAWDAWIEIVYRLAARAVAQVASRMGRVD